ncbi:MAG TPA: VOC family protein [Longimicrobium sp.]
MSGEPEVREVFTYLCVADGDAAIRFYTRVFGARETMRLQEPGGRVAHAELRLGPTTLMLSGEFPELGIRSPLAYGGTGTTLHLHVDDVDALTRRAEAAGATVLRPPADQAHGERQGRIRDPFGHEWLLGHPTGAPLTDDEIRRRFEASAG